MSKRREKLQEPGATSPEMREAILRAMARKALTGNVTAAKIVLDACAQDTQQEGNPLQRLVDAIERRDGVEPGAYGG